MTLKEALILSYVKRGIGHGYSILTHVRKSRSDEWVDFSRAGLYKTLEKLEKEKRISMTLERSGNRPSKKVYSITASGEAALASFIDTEFDFSFRTKNDLDSYLVTAVAASPDAGFIVNKVRERITAVEQHIGELETEWPADHDSYPFIVFTLYKRRLDSLKQERKWLNWFAGVLENIEGDVMHMNWGQANDKA